MSDTDTKRIEAILGPYRGQQLDVPADIADQAIEDGWARDPFAPPSDDPPLELTEEDRMAAIEAAEKAGRRLRGEPAEAGDDKAKAKAGKKAEAPPHKTREMEAGEAAKPYTTREAPAKK